MSGPTDVVADLTDALRQWLPEQRWFAGKDRPVLGVTVVRTATLRGQNSGGDDPELLHAIVAVDQGGTEPDHYQLLLGLRRELPENLGHAWVAAGDSRAIYDATHDPDLTARLLELIAHNSEIDGLRFVPEPDAEIDAVHRSRPVGVEQSHTSLIYGHAYILKLFRRLITGPSPDLELHRALAGVGCPHIAAPLGAIEGRRDGAVVTLGMLNEYLPNTADGWSMATASIRDLLAEAESSAADVRPEDVGGDFASEAHRLGNAVATVHGDLARALGRTEADSGELGRLTAGMHRRLDAVLASVPSLGEHEVALRSAFDEVAALPRPVPVQRAHGDLHLGQVLRAVTGWVLIDFEGEPAAPLAERVAPVSPLRDVAGMLRSFDYAAHHMLVGETDPGRHSDAALEWAGRNQQAFCDGYTQGGGDPRAQPALLRAFELDKAVYEVAYEHANRPTWLPIPLAAIARITS